MADLVLYKTESTFILDGFSKSLDVYCTDNGFCYVLVEAEGWESPMACAIQNRYDQTFIYGPDIKIALEWRGNKLGVLQRCRVSSVKWDESSNDHLLNSGQEDD